MAHHSSELLADLGRDVRKMALDHALGATGEFPRGKVNPQDEGEISMAVAADPRTETVVINFGKPVAWLALEYDDALALSESIRDKALELRGIANS